MDWKDLSKAWIAPSILAGDFGQLANEAKKAEKYGANLLHLDVMDGHFVPNITFGPDAVQSIRKATNLFLDAHLMISDPVFYAKYFVDAGVNSITFHYESVVNIKDTITEIKKLGVQCGISVKPKTDIQLIEPFLKDLDLVLIMSVEPGFGGQSFMENMMDKVRWTRAKIDQNKIKLAIQVDGGINLNNIKIVSQSGANVFVAGSAIYGTNNMKDAILKLRQETELN